MRLDSQLLTPNSKLLIPNCLNLLHAINLGDTDAANLAVNQHLAGSALAYAALQAASAAFQAMTVHGITCLMEGCGYGLALLALDWFAFIKKLDFFTVNDVNNWMLGYAIHGIRLFFVNKVVKVLRVAAAPENLFISGK